MAKKPSTPDRVRPQRKTTADDAGETDNTQESDETEDSDADPAESQGDADTGEASEGSSEPAQKGEAAAGASDQAEPAEKAGWATRNGEHSSKPAPKPAAMPRPYLDSPRDFGIHHKGLLLRFKKGRTPLSEEHADALEKDSYTADNGAEVVR